MLKKFIKIIFHGTIALISLTYITIVVGNNCIANNIEKELKNIVPPKNTKIVDSISGAGKFTGNGNGMQYFGAILIESELHIDELKSYYQTFSEDIIDVVEQESPYIFDSTYYSEYIFEKFDPDTKNYVVHSWEYNDSSWNYEESGFISNLLNLDLRGH